MLTKVAKITAEHKLIIPNYNHNLINDSDDNDDIKIIEAINITNSIKPKDKHLNEEKAMIKCVDIINLKEENNRIITKSTETAECFHTYIYINKKDKLNFSSVPQLQPEIPEIKEAHLSNKKNNENMEEDLMSEVHNSACEVIENQMNDNIIIEDNDFSYNVNIKQELLNDTNQDDIFSTKQEPDWGCFSQIDLVEINDDEDSIFPFSQLFDKTVVKEELEEQDNVLQKSSLFLDDDDENVITILDSDDENACEINKAIDIGPRIKDEPKLEFSEMTMDIIPVLNNVQNICLNNIDIPGNDKLESNTITEYTITNTEVAKSKEQGPSLPNNEVLSKALVLKDASVSNKIKKKGPEIIEPHFMKPKKQTEKKEQKKLKNNEESSKKISNKKDKHLSGASNSSLVKRSINEKLSSKGKKHKKDTSQSSSSRSKRIDQNHQANNKEKKHTLKYKNILLINSKKYKDTSEKEKHYESVNKSDSSPVDNVSLNSEIQNSTRPRHKTTIVKVKISTKTRGDMLCDSMQTLKPKIKTKKSNSTKKETSKPSIKSSQISSFVIPRRPATSSIISNSSSVLDVNELNNVPSTSYNKQTTSSILSNATNTSNVNNSKSMAVMQTSEEDKISSDTQPLKSSLTVPFLLNTSQKRVSFKENISSIREFGIEEGNQLKNIKVGLSIKSKRKDFTVYKATELKIEDFLARVFAWEPVWLEQQQTVKSLPPIVKQEDMHKMPNYFNTFEEYYKKMEVLLLLETWHQLLKEYECTGNRYEK
jgi:hypothetical protein